MQLGRQSIGPGGIAAHHRRQSFGWHRPSHQRFHQPATGLAIAAVESGLRPADPRRTNGRILPATPPGAAAGQRTHLALRRSWAGTALHRDPSGTGSTPTTRPAEVPSRRRPAPPSVTGRGRRHAAEHAGDVGVDDRDICFERERQHGPRRVGADPRQPQQARRGSRGTRRAPRSAWPRHAGSGLDADSRVPATAEARRPTMPPHTTAGVRKRREERLPLRDHPQRLRLLQHHLTDEDRPRVAGLSPRQIAQPRQAPPQDLGVDLCSRRFSRSTRRRRRTVAGARERCRASTPSPCDGSSRPPGRAD